MFDVLEPQERVALVAALQLGFAMTTDTGDERLFSDFERGFSHITAGLEIHQILGLLNS